MVRPDHLRVLRRDRGQRLHVLHTEEWLAHQGTVGKAVLGEVLILDEDVQRVPDGHAGHGVVQGATNFEYFNDPEKTPRSRDRRRHT